MCIYTPAYMHINICLSMYDIQGDIHTVLRYLVQSYFDRSLKIFQRDYFKIKYSFSLCLNLFFHIIHSKT